MLTNYSLFYKYIIDKNDNKISKIHSNCKREKISFRTVSNNLNAKNLLLFKIIKNMNYGQLFKTVEHVHKKTKKNKISILKDVVNCGLKYQAGYTDYRLFEMYNLNEKQRRTIVTRGINNDLVKRYNNPEYKDYFNDRSK